MIVIAEAVSSIVADPAGTEFILQPFTTAPGAPAIVGAMAPLSITVVYLSPRQTSAVFDCRRIGKVSPVTYVPGSMKMATLPLVIAASARARVIVLNGLERVPVSRSQKRRGAGAGKAAAGENSGGRRGQPVVSQAEKHAAGVRDG